ncbi:galactonate dehydratase [Lentzea flaviverrucosa]|uniref:Galactonate dehydratase n=1 Tax=Lentzea flaviverrucosa TaxID=200379 RepID=A0A1H9G3I7_9PSEU|nr:galactonate dehydratase [Lentzea flaviverrucosa]RDI35023.1 galactonate dehydratase [Lentzea flaviverrucosa]SEQ44639.1 galactonate dehydratase [Lentzea flaviverrucosa]
MKVTAVETFLVEPRWLFLKVSTDEGVTGWGEPVVEGRAETVRAAVHELSELVVGQDPLRVEDLWQVLRRGGFYRGGPVLSSALSGYDHAFWDIAGKARGLPVHELLGGPVRDRVRAYSWVGGDRPDGVHEAVARQVAAGFSAVKMNATAEMRPIASPADTEAVLARAREAREALGPQRDLAIDFHGRVSPAMARRLVRMLEEVQPMFVEEPVLPELPAEVLASVVRASTVPIATGERLFSRWEFKPVLDAGVAVVQPDPSHAGGISELRRIGALAEVYGASIAPHCPLGPISLAASLQVAFTTPNFLIQEQSAGMHYNGSDPSYLVDMAPVRVVDGWIARPAGPGLGVEVDEAAVRRAAEIGHAWRSPIWRHDDGSFAEW